jgi:hypothetical protein
MPAKIIHVPNLARSAMAPEIRATVMMANTAWNATKAMAGRLASVSSISPLSPRYCSGLPDSPAPTSSPKEME